MHPATICLLLLTTSQAVALITTADDATLSAAAVSTTNDSENTQKHTSTLADHTDVFTVGTNSIADTTSHTNASGHDTRLTTVITNKIAQTPTPGKSCSVGLIFTAEYDENLDTILVYDKIIKLSRNIMTYRMERGLPCTISVGMLVKNSLLDLIPFGKFLDEFTNIVEDMTESSKYFVSASDEHRLKRFTDSCNETIYVVLTGDEVRDMSSSSVQYELLVLTARHLENTRVIIAGVNVIPVFRFLAAHKHCTIVDETDLWKATLIALVETCSGRMPEDIDEFADSIRVSYRIQPDTMYPGVSSSCNISMLVIDALVDNTDIIHVQQTAHGILVNELENELNCSGIEFATQFANTKAMFEEIGTPSHPGLSSVYLVSSVLANINNRRDWKCKERALVLSLNNELSSEDRETLDFVMEQLLYRHRDISVLVKEHKSDKVFTYSNIMASGRHVSTNNDMVVHAWLRDTLKKACSDTTPSGWNDQLDHLYGRDAISGTGHTQDNNTCDICVIYTGTFHPRNTSNVDFEALRQIYTDFESDWDTCRVQVGYIDEHNDVQQVTLQEFVSNNTDLWSPNYTDSMFYEKISRLAYTTYIWRCNSTVLLVSAETVPRPSDQQWLYSKIIDIANNSHYVVSVLVGIPEPATRHRSDFVSPVITVPNAKSAVASLLKLATQICPMSEQARLYTHVMETTPQVNMTTKPTPTTTPLILPNNTIAVVNSVTLCGNIVSAISIDNNDTEDLQNDIHLSQDFKHLITYMKNASKTREDVTNIQTGITFLTTDEEITTYFSQVGTNGFESIVVFINIFGANKMNKTLRFLQDLLRGIKVFIDVPKGNFSAVRDLLDESVIGRLHLKVIERQVVVDREHFSEYVAGINMIKEITDDMTHCNIWQTNYSSMNVDFPCDSHITVVYLDKSIYKDPSAYRSNNIHEYNKNFALEIKRRLKIFENVGIVTSIHDVNTEFSKFTAEEARAEADSMEDIIVGLYLDLLDDFKSHHKQKTVDILVLIDAPVFDTDYIENLEAWVDDTDVAVILDVKVPQPDILYEKLDVPNLTVSYRKLFKDDSTQKFLRVILNVIAHKCSMEAFSFLLS